MKTYYLILIFSIIVLGCSDQQLNDKSNFASITDTSCNFEILYDHKEYLDSGATNWIWAIANFDTTKPKCWDGLADLYFNLALDSLTKIQHTYFIIADKNSPQINSLTQIMESPQIKSRVIGMHEYGEGIETYNFKPFPFK